MKRRILSLALAVVMALTVAPIVPSIAAVPEGSIIQDPAFYALVLTQIRKPDGYVITAADVSGLTHLNVNNRDIYDLTGIEHFTALTYLDCSWNQLTKLDVSKNAALTHLECADNQLTELDVSKNAALETLWCSWNQLTELDVSESTKLTALLCYRNQLTELDVSKNTALKRLWCSWNQLTELDVSESTKLTDLACDNNQLTALDVSKNTALERLWCEYNNMADYSAVIGFSGVWDGDDFRFAPQNTPANPLDTASDWARPHITAAIEKGFVPADIRDNYKSTITRAEFCRMAVMWLEYKLGKGIDAIVAERGYPERMELTFTDTDDPNILAAYRLGVTSGTDKPGIFNPNGQFTRQEAATMIMNTCRAAGFDMENIPPADFKDLDSVPLWAQPGVNFVRANLIMSGDGTNFNPAETFSREQSIITFNNVK